MLRWLYPLADDSTTIEDIYRMGGAAMYPLMLLALLTVPMAIGLVSLHLTSGRKTGTRLFALLALGFGAFPIGIGLLAEASGKRMMNEALASIDPEDHAYVRMHGLAESAVPKRFGLAIGAPLLLAGAGMLVTGRRRPPEEETIVEARPVE